MRSANVPARLPVPALALLAALLAGGCLSPEEYRDQADREVYSLIDSRRVELFSEPPGFNIEPPQDSLRQRILRDEWHDARPLTLLDCLDIAAENNRQYQANKEALYRVALDLTLEQWEFENQGFASIFASANRAGTGSNSVGTANVGGDTGVQRMLGNGAVIVADIGIDLFRVITTGDGWDAIGDMGLSVTQPLMRGSGELVVKEPLTQAENNLVYEVRAFERFRRSFAVDVARRVYDLLEAGDTLKNEEQNYANLVSLRERNEALSLAGRLSDIEADQARQEELRGENTVIAARVRLARQTDDFMLFLGLPVGTPFTLDPGEFTRLDDVDPVFDSLDEIRSIDFALRERLDYRTTVDQMIDAERLVTVAADALRAGLALDVSARDRTPEGQPAAFRANDVNWATSLSLDLPIDRLRERNAYRRTLIALDTSRRDVEEQGDQITAEVRDGFRRVEATRKSYLIQKDAASLAQRRVESALLNLEAGRASTRDVLDSQESLVLAQNAETFALIEFTLARLELYLELEILRVDAQGIRIDEDLTRFVTTDGTDAP